MRGSELRRLLALLALLATPALADWKQDYARGLEAAKDGRWADVDRHMQGALADNPNAAERVRLYGQRFEAYVPQHYAGLAALRLGDCNKARCGRRATMPPLSAGCRHWPMRRPRAPRVQQPARAPGPDCRTWPAVSPRRRHVPNRATPAPRTSAAINPHRAGTAAGATADG
jgi:hypothetical protein